MAFVLMAGLGMLAEAVTVSRWPHLPAASRSSFDPVSTVLSGHQLAQLAVGVLGVLVISSEYSSGMIRTTLTAVPRRLPVLGSKAAVLALVTLVAMTTASLAAFAAGMAVLSSRHLQVALAAPGVLRAVAGAGLYLAEALTGLPAGGLPGIARSRPGDD